MADKKRLANFELLRILAMLMVVTMHFLSHTGGLPAAGDSAETVLSGRGLFGILTEAFCIVAVNVYVLISGYFLSVQAFSWKRLIRLLCQILFYTLLIPLGLVAAGVLPAAEAFDIYHIWSCLFPVESGHYWFMTAYVVMLLFSPLLNAAADHMERRSLKAVIVGLLVFFCVGKSVSPFLFASDRFGYDFGWFLCLYLIAAYLRRYGSRLLHSRKKCALLYLFSCLGSAALVAGALLVCAKTGFLEYYVTVPFHYNFILSLTGALGLFMFFARLRVPDGKLSELVCRLSPAMLGVYLIHEHVDISARWTGWLIGEPSVHVGGYFMQLLESVLLLVFVASCIDLLRGRLFFLAERRIGRWCRKDKGDL